VPLQRAALEERVAALEQSVGELQLVQTESAESTASSIAASVEAVPLPLSGINWPHMADNVFLGMVVLIAAHWLATTLPVDSRPLFLLVALVVALPFGYRFERHTGSDVSEQVIAALAYGCLGTLALGLLDMALGVLTAHSPSGSDTVAAVAAISLSHFVGTALAQGRRGRADQAASATACGSGRLPQLEAAPRRSRRYTRRSHRSPRAAQLAGQCSTTSCYDGPIGCRGYRKSRNQLRSRGHADYAALRPPW
jgi:hypothetical protein